MLVHSGPIVHADGRKGSWLADGGLGGGTPGRSSWDLKARSESPLPRLHGWTLPLLDIFEPVQVKPNFRSLRICASWKAQECWGLVRTDRFVVLN